jgi:hypothetical protein
MGFKTERGTVFVARVSAPPPFEVGLNSELWNKFFLERISKSFSLRDKGFELFRIQPYFKWG